jgi:hypothetical protein
MIATLPHRAARSLAMSQKRARQTISVLHGRRTPRRDIGSFMQANRAKSRT